MRAASFTRERSLVRNQPHAAPRHAGRDGDTAGTHGGLHGVTPLDIDDQASWPAGLSQWVAARAAEIQDVPEYTSDLPGRLLESEFEIHELSGNTKLLAYHCTCLLPHEAAVIRNEGLRPLTSQLVDDRIAAAVQAGVAASVVNRARRGNVYAIDNAEGREGQVCLIAGRSAFDDSPHGCDPLLRYWGGEALRGGPADARELELGTPSIVVAQLDCRHSPDLSMYPSLGKLLVGALLGTSLLHADVFYRRPVASEDILAIWQPGNPEYDRHTRLPARHD